MTGRLVGVSTPTQPTDAANKSYVDAAVSGVTPSGVVDDTGSADTTDDATTVPVLSVDVAAELVTDGGGVFDVDLIGVRQGTLEVAAWQWRVVVKVSGGSLSIQTPYPLLRQERLSSAGITAASAALAASSGSLVVNVVGIAGSTIKWTARISGLVRTQS